MNKKRIIAIITVVALSLTVVLMTTAKKTDAGGYSYVDESGKIDLPAYFTTKGAKASLQKESMDFVMQEDEATVTFNKPLASDSFALAFSGVKGNTLKRIDITLTDVENENETVTIIYEAMSAESSLVRIANTARSNIIDGSFFMENDYDFFVHYSAEYRHFSDDVNYKVPVLESLNGTIFPGFSSHKVIMNVRLYGKNGSIFRVKEINRQRMGSLYSEDTENPGITIVNQVNKAVLGSTIPLQTAFATDVLADEATITMSVEDPEGKVVTAVDGTKLKEVSPEKVYRIKIDKSGTYRVLYKATDGKNSTRSMSYPIMVADNEAPIITVEEKVAVSTKVGDKLTFPKVSYSDNASNADAITKWTTVKYPSGVVFEEKNSVELTQEGVYEITFSAMDEAGNISRKTVKTYAEGE